jgi:hypothetical protein
MENDKKASLYKYLFLISTICGALGAFSLYKGMTSLGWILAGIWLVLGIAVRVLMIKNK